MIPQLLNLPPLPTEDELTLPALPPLPTKSQKLYVGRLDGARNAGVEKVRQSLKRHNLVDNVPMLAHVVNWMEHKGIKMETLAGQDASDRIVDLLFSAYWEREENFTMNGKAEEILAGDVPPPIPADAQIQLDLDGEPEVMDLIDL